MNNARATPIRSRWMTATASNVLSIDCSLLPASATTAEGRVAVSTGNRLAPLGADPCFVLAVKKPHHGGRVEAREVMYAVFVLPAADQLECPPPRSIGALGGDDRSGILGSARQDAGWGFGSRF